MTPPPDVPPPGIEPDDLDSGRMTMLEHLLELRTRLIVAIAALAVGFAICFVFAQDIYNWLLEPFEAAAGRVRGEDGEGLRLIYTAPLEFFFAKVKLALFGGFVLAFPVIAYQVYGFIAPGLYKNERRAAAPFALASPVLFLAGGALVYYAILPFVLAFALGQEQTATQGPAIELLARVSDYLSLVTTLIIAFGLSFQMPVGFCLAARAGLLTAKQLLGTWRYALLGILVVAAFATPPDPISQIFLATALFGLYALAIAAVWLMEKASARSDESADVSASAAE